MTIPGISPKATAYDFAITVTFSRLLKKLSSQQQFDKTEDITSFFRIFPKVTCIAELTKSSDIHYHAILQPSKPMSLDQMNYFINNRSKQYGYGFCVTKLVDDYAGWTQYITKDISLTQSLLDRNPIKRDDYNLIPPIFPQGQLADRKVETESAEIEDLDAVKECIKYIEKKFILKI